LKDLFDGNNLILFSQLRDVFAVVVVEVVVADVVVVEVVVADVVVVEVVVADVMVADVEVVAVLVVAVVVVASQANTTVQLRTGQGSSTPVFC